MKIGFDLDNTITDCDEIFNKIASQSVNVSFNGASRESIRLYIREHFSDRLWTKIQASVYGVEYINAVAQDRSLDIIKLILHEFGKQNTYIISHKTEFDHFYGKYNLRKISYDWLDKIFNENQINFDRKNIIFCETLPEKIEKIKNLEIDYFIDDLKEVVVELEQTPVAPFLYIKRDCKCDWDSFYRMIKS